VSGAMMSGLRIHRNDPRHGAVGEPLLVQYAVTNRNRFFSIFNIHLREMPDAERTTWPRLMGAVGAWVMHVGPGETVHGEAVHWPHRRGEARFDQVRAYSTFPFGLLKKSVTFSQPQHTLIYPLVYELQPRVLDAISMSGLTGVRASQQPGSGDEYFGMREYRIGDPLRQISWKRSATRDALVTIERTQPNPPRLRVVLDLTIATNDLPIARTEGVEHAREREENAISFAASLLRMADARGFEIGLTIMGIDTPSIPLRRNQWHFHKMMAALAGIDLDSSRTETRVADIVDFERAGLAVVHPDRVDLSGRDDAWHVSASQLDALAVRQLGVDVNPDAEHNDESADDESTEAAA
ncbi:MAG: DUF58 domain-containing protein, partial [Planctomycetota bacterium]